MSKFTMVTFSFLLIFFMGASVGADNEYIKPPETYQADAYDNSHGQTVLDLPYHETTLVAPGWEERGSEFRKWLSPSVRIGGGSGTMCYFDEQTGWMYIISCGHLFDRGRKSKEECEKNKIIKKIDVFYQNNVKLDVVKQYEGEVVAYVWGSSISSVYDVSVIRFKPDWKDPWCLPIAPLDFKYKPGDSYHSCGCDGRSEVAHYLVDCKKEAQTGNITEVITERNGPRNGRSGGGLFTDDGQLIGICSRGGDGKGYWSSLTQIYKFLKEEKLDFILEGIPQARLIPIFDENRPQSEYLPAYIPLPSNAGYPIPTEIAPHLLR